MGLPVFTRPTPGEGLWNLGKSLVSGALATVWLWKTNFVEGKPQLIGPPPIRQRRADEAIRGRTVRCVRGQDAQEAELPERGRRGLCLPLALPERRGDGLDAGPAPVAVIVGVARIDRREGFQPGRQAGGEDGRDEHAAHRTFAPANCWHRRAPATRGGDRTTANFVGNRANFLAKSRVI